MGTGNSRGMGVIKSERFVSNSFSELEIANRNPIYGYEHLPVLPLEKTVEGLVGFVPGLATYVVKAKANYNRDSKCLTHDESAAIYLYSMQIPFVSSLNAALRSKNQDAVKPWFAFLELFLNALQMLPSLNATIWRGIAGNIGSSIVEDQVQTCWSVNSCSSDTKGVECYLGEKGGTVFTINTINAKDISAYSAYIDEREVVLMPETSLCTESNPFEFENRLFIVHMKEQSKPGQQPPQ